MTTPPIITDVDAAIDSAWFAAHNGRTCYARMHASGVVLVVKQVTQGRDQLLLLRTWAQFERIPEDEGEGGCLALWDRCAQGAR